MVQVERPNTNEKFALRQKIRKWKKGNKNFVRAGESGMIYGFFVYAVVKSTG
jgi:hypothetical protein